MGITLRYRFKQKPESWIINLFFIHPRLTQYRGISIRNILNIKIHPGFGIIIKIPE